MACSLIGKRMAPIKFGPVIQGAGATHDPNLSWLHLVVRINKPFPWEDRTVERCEAKICFGATEYDLRWRSRDSLSGRGFAQITLLNGHQELLPIAARSTGDSDDMRFGKYTARITDECALVHGRDFHDFGQGDYKFTILLKSGLCEWRSGVYTLKVPDKNADNGHFLIVSESN
jgi:hypothetical protein